MAHPFEPTLYRWKGEDRTLTELAIIVGVKRETMRSRVRKHSVEKAMTMTFDEKMSTRTYRKIHAYQGELYTSEELAEMIGINVRTMSERIRVGGVAYAMDVKNEPKVTNTIVRKQSYDYNVIPEDIRKAAYESKWTENVPKHLQLL